MGASKWKYKLSYEQYSGGVVAIGKLSYEQYFGGVVAIGKLL